MAHQLLHNLELGPSSAEQSRVCPAECVPPDPLRDAQSLRDRADVMTKKLLSPIRVLSPILRAGEHPTLRRFIGRSAPPVPQTTDQIVVEGHGLLRSLRLDLVAREDVRSTAAFGTLPHPLNRVAVVEIVATGMVEQDAHHVPDFGEVPGARCRCLSHSSTSTALMFGRM